MIYLTDREVAERYGVSRVTVWRWRRNDRNFPAPISFSPGCVRFKLADLEAWENEKQNVEAK